MAPLFAGIDLGTTFTAAAVARPGGPPEMVSLGPSGASIPSVVYLREDGSIATGTAALQRSAAEPDRVAAEFKRRVGDPAPIFMAGTPMAAHLLMARLLRWVSDRIVERQGEEITHTVVTHPANWGAYKRDYLRQAAERAGLGSWSTLTEPEAAAIHYATRQRVDPGETVAVYDLGGGTFDAAILRRTEDSFEIVGRPHGIENLGGIDFDQTIFNHVVAQVSEHLGTLDQSDPAVLSALHRLRRDAENAKIALSSEADTAIPLTLPGLHTTVRLTRAEFEGMIRPTLSETIDSLRQTLTDAGVAPEELAKVLLVGGSSRIPLVAQMVTDALGRPVAVDADPKHAIALGAALHARTAAGTDQPSAAGAPVVEGGPEPADETEPEEEVGQTAPAPAAEEPPGEPAADDEEAATPRPRSDAGQAATPVPTATTPPPPTRAAAPDSDGPSPRRWLAGAALLVVAVVAGIFLLDRGGGDDDTASTVAVAETAAPTTAATPTTAAGGAVATTAPPDLTGTRLRVSLIDDEHLPAIEVALADRFALPTGSEVVLDPFDLTADLVIAAQNGEISDVALVGFTPATSPDLAQAIEANAVALEDLGYTVDQLEAAFGPHLVAQGEVGGKHFLIPVAHDPRSVVFFHQQTFTDLGLPIPQTLDELLTVSAGALEAGFTPWCIGAESGAASGWPMTHTLEEYVLRTAGPEIYDQWVDHDIPFDHPAIAAAAGSFQELWASEGFVFGGPEAIADTDFRDAMDPMFDSPPGCLMHRQGSFMVNFFPDGAEIGGEVGLFPFPGVGQGGSVVAARFAVFFDDRPEIRAFIDTLLDPTVHCDMASLTDQVAAHIDTPVECHAGPIAAVMAPEILADLQSDSVRLTASDQMATEVTSAFWAGMIDWVNGTPTETVLANIESAWPPG